MARGLVVGLIVGALLSGCERPGDCQLHLQNPYRVGEVVFHGSDIGESWAPLDEDVLGWVEGALGETDRGISRTEWGMPMRATLSRRVELEHLGDRSRLVVGLEAQLERVMVPAGAPMVFLTADVEYRHGLAEQAPSEDLLRALARTLERRAAQDVVQKLRLRARIRQSGPAELARWIIDRSVPAAERIYAIRRAPQQGTPALERALSEAAEDEEPDVAVAAVRGLLDMGSDRATHRLMAVAQRLSRDREYDHFLECLNLLGRLDDAWVSIYLETVADAHRFQGARARARHLVADRPSPVQAEGVTAKRAH